MVTIRYLENASVYSLSILPEDAGRLRRSTTCRVGEQADRCPAFFLETAHYWQAYDITDFCHYLCLHRRAVA